MHLLDKVSLRLKILLVDELESFGKVFLLELFHTFGVKSSLLFFLLISSLLLYLLKRDIGLKIVNLWSLFRVIWSISTDRHILLEWHLSIIV